ncbi:FkbM family methyltransferase [Planktomarina temperata]|nr:FkbM family methyltransferase [Planktomarina temperata]
MRDLVFEEAAVLRRLQPDVIIDCGAFEGREATRYLLSTNADVWLFEPQPDLFKNLSGRFDQNQRVRLYEVALSDRASHQNFYINTNKQTSSLLQGNFVVGFDNDMRTETEISVRLDRLDHIKELSTKNRIHMKIDVQGHELSLLKGCTGILSKVHSLVVETHILDAYSGQSKMTDVFNFLIEEGFTCRGVYNQLKNTDYALLQFDSLWVRS